MRVAKGAERLREAGRRVRSRFVPGGLILLYHRVSDAGAQPLRDPFRLCVSPQNFETHLEILRAVGEPVSLQELAWRIASRRSVRGCFAVTFDDGYLDNLSSARPLLEQHSTPATFFVIAGALGRSFWWDRLARAIESLHELPERLRIDRDGAYVDWAPRGGDVRSRLQLLRSLHRLFRDRSPDSRRSLMSELGLSWEETSASDGRTRAVDEAELIQLGSGDLFEIGAHGLTHLPLSSLAPSDQRKELEAGRNLLERVTGTQPTSFSYPYGTPKDYTSETVRLVAAAGYERACTNTLDVVTASSDPLRLPRLWVRDWTAQELTRVLRRWLRR